MPIVICFVALAFIIGALYLAGYLLFYAVVGIMWLVQLIGFGTLALILGDPDKTASSDKLVVKPRNRNHSMQWEADSKKRTKGCWRDEVEKKESTKIIVKRILERAENELGTSTRHK